MYIPPDKITISNDVTILATLEAMDQRDLKLLMIIDTYGKYKGLISAGDIQRAILRNIDLNTSIESIIRKDIKEATIADSTEDIHELMRMYRMEFMPVLDEQGNLINVIMWEEIFSSKPSPVATEFNLPVVLMAGGLGSRMRPLTNVLPKPLIPVGELTIAEEIFERFAKYGVNRFLLSLNYKADFIESYLFDLNLPYHLSSYREEKPLGTIGSIRLMKDELKTTFFVSNCDILINEDYSAILNYHKASNNEITVVSALKTVKLPYGIIETVDEGQIAQLKEKPSLGFNVNTGMYIIEPHVIDKIPENKFYNVTDLIQQIMDQGGRVGAFPVSEKSWVDTGVWEEYLKHFVQG